ncbi:MAG: lipoprotein [Proteobacteria bacterium]|nr:lipoprotein [Pseudomonadota bacterium]
MSSSDRLFFRLAVIGALAFTLGLAACGRKGPLDPPPSAAATGETQPAQSNSPSLLNPVGVSPMGGGAGGGSYDAMEPPKGEKKRIPLDVLLN